MAFFSLVFLPATQRSILPPPHHSFISLARSSRFLSTFFLCTHFFSLLLPLRLRECCALSLWYWVKKKKKKRWRREGGGGESKRDIKMLSFSFCCCCSTWYNSFLMILIFRDFVILSYIFCLLSLSVASCTYFYRVFSCCSRILGGAEEDLNVMFLWCNENHLNFRFFFFL